MNLWSCNQFVSMSALQNKLPMCEWSKWHVWCVCVRVCFSHWARNVFAYLPFTYGSNMSVVSKSKSKNACIGTIVHADLLLIAPHHRSLYKHSAFSSFRLKCHIMLLLRLQLILYARLSVYQAPKKNIIRTILSRVMEYACVSHFESRTTTTKT